MLLHSRRGWEEAEPVLRGLYHGYVATGDPREAGAATLLIKLYDRLGKGALADEVREREAAREAAAR